MADIGVAYTGMPCICHTYIGMACIGTAYIGMAYVVTAYLVMAYIDVFKPELQDLEVAAAAGHIDVDR